MVEGFVKIRLDFSRSLESGLCSFFRTADGNRAYIKTAEAYFKMLYV